MAAARQRRILSKGELFDRVACRAQRRGFTLSRRQFEGWRDRALLMAGERLSGAGRAPKWAFDYRHYRRALQLVRLYTQGVKDTDAIVVQLFARGYGAAPCQFCKALPKEFRKADAMLLAPIRSTYAQLSGEIPTGGRRALLKQLGPLDPRLAASGFGLNSDDLITVFRGAVNPEGVVGRVNPPTTASPGLSMLLPIVWPTLLEILAGTLALDEEFPNQVQEAISDPSDEDIRGAGSALDAVRTLFRAFDNAPLLAIFGGGANGVPGRLVSKSLMEREYCALSLAILIYLIRNFGRNSVTDAVP